MQADASDSHVWHLYGVLAKAMELITPADARWKQFGMSPDAAVEIGAIRLLVAYNVLILLLVDRQTDSLRLPQAL